LFHPSHYKPYTLQVGSVFALIYSLRLRSCRLMGAFVISPLPPFLIKTACSAGPLRSAGVTPPRRYYEPSRHRLVFSPFPGFRRLYEVPCSTGFPMGPGRFLQLLRMSLLTSWPCHPAGGGTTLRSGCVIPCCLRPYTESSASGFCCVEATCGFILITAR